MSVRTRIALFAAALPLLGASACRIYLPEDPMLNLDYVDGAIWNAAEIVPDTPWMRPGGDREFGTADDWVHREIRGDVDLVLRTGLTALGAAVPAPSLARTPSSWPAGIAEPFGAGTPIPYVVAAVDSWHGPPPGALGAPPYWNGLPILVLAFADLDGDGVVGTTLLDGDPADRELEEAEWIPVGRHFTIGANELANGALQIGVGGPHARPVRVVLGAATWAGEFDPAFLGGTVPRGPFVTTRLPFLPEMNPQRVLEGGANGPPPATPDALVGVEVRPALAPDPSDPRIGESYTLRLDGSDATTDGALVTSGAPSRFGAVRRPDAISYVGIPERPLRPGLAPGATPIGVEVLRRVLVADDGPGTRTAVRIVALDQLGNVVEPGVSTSVVLRGSGPLRIAFPDQDGDASAETVTVTDAIGVEIEIDDTGDAQDGPDAGALRIESAGSLSRIDVLLPDADVDDSGAVDAGDVDAIRGASGDRLGDPGFEPSLDLDASGRIDEGDESLANAALGTTPTIP